MDLMETKKRLFMVPFALLVKPLAQSTKHCCTSCPSKSIKDCRGNSLFSQCFCTDFCSNSKGKVNDSQVLLDSCGFSGQAMGNLKKSNGYVVVGYTKVNKSNG